MLMILCSVFDQNMYTLKCKYIKQICLSVDIVNIWPIKKMRS